ncbi:fused MFS/spermidine synthase [Chitinispirillales bacterium ANBcel5]|uniref:fused MFS/spermidine synthase n=1 Tax=Cellulosispirillum alkaliphilum TaxID=3039283 RepID=UPI002A4FDDC1|nr:fused MFS/spermidine synthase [Chitinispirillales bacterium ANBcel5]
MLLYSLLLFSSLAGFMVELVWIRRLSAVFGNRYDSVPVIFAALFIGFAAGSYFSLKRRKSVFQALKTFAGLNIVALLGLIAAYLLFNWQLPFAFFYNLSLTYHPFLFRLFQFLSILVLLLPWSFCYGCSMPLLSFVICSGKRKKSAVFNYFLYSLSGVGGLLWGGFVLIPALGIRITLAISCILHAVIAITCYVYLKSSRGTSHKTSKQLSSLKKTAPVYLILAFISGFCSIGFELMLMRSFALIDNNSFYSFTILLSFIVFSFSVGALLISVAPGKVTEKRFVVPVLLSVIALLLLIVPALFVRSTDGILPLRNSSSWFEYFSNILGVSLFTVIVPSCFIGMLLPILIKKASGDRGENVGTLITANIVGVIVASVFFGLFHGTVLSLWQSIRVIGLMYSIGAIIYAVIHKQKQCMIVTSGIAVVVIVVTASGNVPLVWKNVALRGMDVIEVKEVGGETVSLVAGGNVNHILVNNQYSIGSNHNIDYKKRQAVLPMSIHPNPQSVCFIGMGTGITAGASLLFNPQRVVVCEISPGVISFAKKYYSTLVNGLFDDKRVNIIFDDGRTYLSYTVEQFDLIISELFIPWQSGTSLLYTTDFYSRVANKLNDGGVFVQWLPLYQMTEHDFGIIARTLSSQFKQVTVWRLNHSVQEPAIALICSEKKIAVTEGQVIAPDIASILGLPPNRKNVTGELQRFYLGSIEEEDWKEYPLNTDDKLPIEYVSPKTHIMDQDKILVGERYRELLGIVDSR